MRVIRNWCMNTQTVSEEQTQIVHSGDLLGRRIKFLRGELSQDEFAKKIGVSRAALANYETGRTVPNESVIRAISSALEISTNFLKTGKAKEEDRLFHLLGLGRDQSGLLTPEEWSVVRGLRACNPETVLKAVQIIADGYFDAQKRGGLNDPLGFAEDVLRLGNILEAGGRYAKGPDQDSVTDRMMALARRVSSLQNDPNEGPQ